MWAGIRHLQRIALTCRHQLRCKPGSCAAPLSSLLSRTTLVHPALAMSVSVCCKSSDTNCWSASLTTAAALVAQLDAAGAASAAGPAQGGAAAPPPDLPPAAKTYYKRALPSPPAIAFSSPEGKRLFGEALAAGGMEGFFPLIEQFRTQDEPAFCGLASLAMVLNALSIDPRRAWKGPWRWFHEALLDCCAPLSRVAQDGVTLTQAACLARCNGATVEAVAVPAPSVEMFRSHVAAATAVADSHLVVAYSRKQFLQTGNGHFSPIGGYHAKRDLVLILDTARFKYPPHWVPLPELYAAMFDRLDPVTGAPRGYLLLGAQPLADSVLLTLGRRNRGWREVQRYIAEGPTHLVAQHGRDFATGAALLAAVVANAPISEVPAFIAARTDGGSGGGGGGAIEDAAAGGPCISPGAVELLLREVAALPLNQVVSAAAPARGSGLPLLAARLCFLLLLVPPAAWDAIPNEQVRGEVRQLLDVSGAAIVAAEAAYLRQQAEQISVLEAESAALLACRRCAAAGAAAAGAAAASGAVTAADSGA